MTEEEFKTLQEEVKAMFKALEKSDSLSLCCGFPHLQREFKEYNDGST